MKKWTAFVIAVVMRILYCSPEVFASETAKGLSSSARLLLQLGLIEEEPSGGVRENDILTVGECLEILDRIAKNSEFSQELYTVETAENEPSPNWSEEKKKLYDNLYNRLVLPGEWEELCPDAPCRYSQAAIWSQRLLTDANGCIAVTEHELRYTPERACDWLFGKGVLDTLYFPEDDPELTRGAFLQWTENLLFASVRLAGFAPRTFRYIEEYEERGLYTPPTETEKEKVFLNSCPVADETAQKQALEKGGLQYWTERGAFDGFPQGWEEEVTSAQSLTRADVAVILWNLRHYPRGILYGMAQYMDTKWYTAAFARMIENGVVRGRQDGDYAPEAIAAKEEAIVMVQRAFGIELSEEVQQENGLSAQVSEWAREPIEKMRAHGYLDGLKGTDLQESITCGEFFGILDRVVAACYARPGYYCAEPGTVIDGNVVLATPDIALENLTINGNLYLPRQNRAEMVYLKNVQVNGSLVLAESVEYPCMVDCTARSVINGTIPTGDFKTGSFRLSHADGSDYIVEGGSDIRQEADGSVTWTLPRNQLGLSKYCVHLIAEDGRQVELNFYDVASHRLLPSWLSKFRTENQMTDIPITLRICPASSSMGVVLGPCMEIVLPPQE